MRMFSEEWLKDITGSGKIYNTYHRNGVVRNVARFNLKKIVDHYFGFIKIQSSKYKEDESSLIYNETERYFLELDYGVNELKIDVIEEIFMRSDDLDDTLRTLLFSMVLQRIDNQDKQLRVRIRELIKRYHTSDILDVMKLYHEIKALLI